MCLAELLSPGRSHDSAVQLALLLDTAYNAAASIACIPAGRAAESLGNARVIAGAGAALFALDHLGLGLTGASVLTLGACFLDRGRRVGPRLDS